LDAENAEKMIK